MRALAAALPVVLASGAVAQEAPLLQVVPDLAAFGEAGLIAGPGEIEKTEAFEMYGRPAIAITLAEGLDGRLAGLTAGRAGERLTIRVCGAIVSQPMLREEIGGREFLISGLDPGVAERILSALKSGSCDGPPIY